MTKLSDEELREKILNIKLTNNWERLFSNKGLNDNFENILVEISKLRNIVANNKLMNKEQYQSLSLMLKSNEYDIDKAIEITENDDFKRIKKEKMDEIWESIREIMQGVAKRMTDLFSNIIPKKTIFDSLSKALTQPSIVDILNKVDSKKENENPNNPIE